MGTLVCFSHLGMLLLGVQSKHTIKRFIISHEVMVIAYTNDILARDEDLSDISLTRYHL